MARWHRRHTVFQGSCRHAIWAITQSIAQGIQCAPAGIHSRGWRMSPAESRVTGEHFCERHKSAGTHPQCDTKCCPSVCMHRLRAVYHL
jgi:hypothetical protein